MDVALSMSSALASRVAHPAPGPQSPHLAARSPAERRRAVPASAPGVAAGPGVRTRAAPGLRLAPARR